MKPNLTDTPLSERRVVRRGLIAGLAGLGAAALLKVTGQGKAEPAEAAATPLVYPTSTADPNFINTAFGTTFLRAGAANFQILLDVDADAATAFSSNAINARGKGGGTGVYATGGTGPVFGGLGVYAQAGSGSNSGAGTPGVLAFGGFNDGSGTGGPGIHGVGGPGASAAKQGPGVQGNSSSGKGVFGQSTSSDGVHGTSTNGVGLRGTSPNFVGLVGISDTNIGLYGYNAAPNVPAFYAENLAGSGKLAGYFDGGVVVTGNLGVYGAKNAVVKMPDGSDAAVYCQESPEPYFEDFGRARLVNGVAHVQLEPEFASMVKRDDYMVFPVPEGDTKGLFIARKDANSFEVREAQGGTSSVPFTYRIVARRRDIEGKRLARLDPQVKANIAQMRAAAAARNHPSVKVPPGGSPLVPLEPIPPMPEPPVPRPER